MSRPTTTGVSNDTTTSALPPAWLRRTLQTTSDDGRKNTSGESSEKLRFGWRIPQAGSFAPNFRRRFAGRYAVLFASYL
ncbi:hypothetical protein CERSUDRAFT_83535 [Gelatoporia subvermispora B]|uniref:Uncharacterized protein n=1 Tax=Ceriporiopsis subvermispora (strain B) TaxID=914234 RepID=M2QL54_CERS8|nr:hypothetical protein CERSUDRAFT_83535 [Gelatoporia subvermispora B]